MCDVRWVDEEFTIRDDLIGLVHVEKTDADSLCMAIKDVLIGLGLRLGLGLGLFTASFTMPRSVL